MLKHASATRSSPVRCLGRLAGKLNWIQNSLKRSLASLTDASSTPATGEKIHGFTLKRSKHVPELHLTALQLEHDRTGAEYLHVAREDRNNVFAINFKTNPTDCTGLPHILEHVTLCGSEKFPVRDPFFKMMPRSLANFMNAFTASDYTSYPFATTNLQDYRNLSSVYLDATLHPLLKHSDFLQEGWRLGQEDPKTNANFDNTKFKGVVYNEMKGQMSDASYLFYVRFREHLFPTLFNSGGDPEKMTNLSYQELVQFSRQHYHPSNAKIFSYGSFDLSSQLQQVNSVLADFDRIEPDSDIKVPLNLDAGPVKIDEIGPFDPMQESDRQTKSSISWIGCSTSDLVENFSLSLVSSLLMSGYGSPLYQGLIEAGLGTNFSPNTGYDASGKIGIFSIGLDGMRAEDAQELKETVQSILRSKAQEAFLQHKIDGYMHQLELALKHKNAGFGMSLLEKTLPGWFNGVDPLEGLAWNDVIEAFRERLAQEGYLESLLEKYLLNNKCLHFTVLPSESYNARLEANEEERRQNILLREKKAAGSSEAVFARLEKQELDLLEEQESSQNKNLDTLPTLRVSDIPQRKESKPVHSSLLNQSDWLVRESSTNGITYFQAKQAFHGLSSNLRSLLPLFTESLMRLGTGSKSVGDLEAEILLRTGGISIAPFVRPDVHSLDGYNEGLLFDGYALDRNVPSMLDLLRQLVLDIDFDSPQAAASILELLESKSSGALDSVAEAGHHFAISTSSAALTERGRVQDQISGLSQIEFTVKLLQQARESSNSLQDVLAQLKEIQQIAISNTSALSLRTVCEPSAVADNRKHLTEFLNQLPSKPIKVQRDISTNTILGSSLSRATFFNLPFQVSYTGSCLQTAPYLSPDKAPLTILGQLLTHNFMHPEIREKGGAYGASASASPISGLFSMSSYRDPNPRNSLSTFARAGKFASERQWTDREIEESKLSVFQGIDAPTSVSAEGSKQFMYGITEEMDQKMREQLLSVTKDDVQLVAKKYLIDLPADQRATCVLGEQKDWIDEAKTDFTIRTLKMSA